MHNVRTAIRRLMKPVILLGQVPNGLPSTSLNVMIGVK